LFDGVQQRFRPSAAGRDALPRHQESSERIGFDRFDLAAEAGERAAPDHVQHVRVDPLTLSSAGAEFSMDNPPVSRDSLQERVRACGVESIPCRELSGCEGAM
jgi:hypothetical protein